MSANPPTRALWTTPRLSTPRCTTWGCIDIVSASTGEMKKRYGYIYVDKDNDGNGDLHREPKDSYFWYKKVVASNGEDLS